MKSQAEKELSLIGNEIQKAQAAEAQIIMEYRYSFLFLLLYYNMNDYTGIIIIFFNTIF